MVSSHFGPSCNSRTPSLYSSLRAHPMSVTVADAKVVRMDGIATPWIVEVDQVKTSNSGDQFVLLDPTNKSLRKL